MDRSLILQMLSKLPPERLGQLMAEAQEVEEGPVQQPLLGDSQIGVGGLRQQQREIPSAYKHIQGGYF